MFFLGFNAFSQDVIGTVYSSGEPLPGVTVINLTTGKGTLTNFDGDYVLKKVSEGDEIEFSYLGFQSQKVVYSGQAELNVTLAESSEQLEEVIVTGYGTQIQKNLSSSISKVKSEDLENIALPSFEQAIQGRAAGVQVVSGSAMSGSPTKIRIRGTNSAVANSEPLYVIDGIIVESGSFMDSNGSVGFMDHGGGNLLASINPNDIESLEILKDAAATAIYGARGSNGVVLITTKSGKSGDTQIDVTLDSSRYNRQLIHLE